LKLGFQYLCFEEQIKFTFGAGCSQGVPLPQWLPQHNSFKDWGMRGWGGGGEKGRHPTWGLLGGTVLGLDYDRGAVPIRRDSIKGLLKGMNEKI
jgi:hypothetical protein